MKSNDKPYCFECKRGKTDGYKHIGNGIWGCAVCGKPSLLFWISHVLVSSYWKELDEIISRILEKRENEDGLDKGRAEIACKFIAMILYPHQPDIKYVRDLAIKQYRNKQRLATLTHQND